MNNRMWLLIAAVVSVGVLLIGWFVGISPELDKKAAAEEQIANVEQQNAGIQVVINQLTADNAKMDEFEAELKELQVALPPGGELSTFLGQLHQLEITSGVVVKSFSAGSGMPFVAVPNGTDTVVSPLVTSANFIVIDVQLNVTGTRQEVLDFVQALQLGDRLFLINSLSVQGGDEVSEDGEGEPVATPYTGNISGYIYVLVDPKAPPPTVTPVVVEPEPTEAPKP